MSQLDMSISFYHIIGLLFCFYIFIHLTLNILVKYWYNKKIRDNDVFLSDFFKSDENLVFLKRIFKI
uniref:ATP synthase F0 subunit 8 n=1 Tax=Bargmannia elongata TaxID=316231 RepID=UPI0026E3AA4A|nr:ATP synthase F0 subunit 8 [Bargmannia elongata]WJJ69976.1 ATP synthase F0 subunit 8 [Bargmannia elongata]